MMTGDDGGQEQPSPPTKKAPEDQKTPGIEKDRRLTSLLFFQFYSWFPHPPFKDGKVTLAPADGNANDPDANADGSFGPVGGQFGPAGPFGPMGGIYRTHDWSAVYLLVTPGSIFPRQVPWASVLRWDSAVALLPWWWCLVVGAEDTGREWTLWMSTWSPNTKWSTRRKMS